MSNKPDPKEEEMKAIGTAVAVMVFAIYLDALAFFTWYDSAWPGFGFFLLDLFHMLLAEVSPRLANNVLAGLCAVIGAPLTFYTGRYLASAPDGSPTRNDRPRP